MIIELEINGARVIVSGENLSVSVTQDGERKPSGFHSLPDRFEFPAPDRIKSLRKSLNMSQAKFAEAIGTTQQNIHRWENGEATPRLEVAMALLRMIEGSAA